MRAERNQMTCFKRFAYVILKVALAVVILVAAGCVPLKEVATFASGSANTLQGITPAYTYYSYKVDSTYIYSRLSNVKMLNDVDCDSVAAQRRDTLLRREQMLMADYYTGLVKLSGTELIDFSPIGKAVEKGNYGGLVISDNDASVFASVADAASLLLTAKYRMKKIKKIFVQHSAAADTLLEILILHFDNLRAKIKVMRAKYETLYDGMIRNAQTDQEKLLLIDSYKQKRKELDDAVNYYGRIIHQVKLIREGNQLMHANIKDLKSKSFKKRIMQIAANISYLNSD